MPAQPVVDRSQGPVLSLSLGDRPVFNSMPSFLGFPRRCDWPRPRKIRSMLILGCYLSFWGRVPYDRSLLCVSGRTGSRVCLHQIKFPIPLSLLRLGLEVLQLRLQRVTLACHKLAVLLGLLRLGLELFQLRLQRVTLACRKLAILFSLLRLGLEFLQLRLQHVPLACRDFAVLLC